MKKRTTIHIPLTLHASLGRYAELRRMSSSDVINEALIPYLNGCKSLEKKEKVDKVETSFTCDDRDIANFKAMLKDANLRIDDVLEVIVSEHIAE